MDDATFSNWVAGAGLLNPVQRGQAFRALALAEARDRIACAEETIEVAAPAIAAGEPDACVPDQGLLAKIGQGRIASVGCPHCGEDEVRPWGKAGGKPRYRCTGCRKTFNPLTGTPLAGLHHRDRWHDQGQALIDGETVAKAAARCQVHYTTAFRWRHRFLSALNHDKPPSLSGIVEADEPFILESLKGKPPDLPRAP